MSLTITNFNASFGSLILLSISFLLLFDRICYFNAPFTILLRVPAISAREQGLSEELKDGFVALPVKYYEIPSGLAAGDLVQIYTGTELLFDSVEVKGLNEVEKTLTLVLNDQNLLQSLEKDATRIVALPRTKKTLRVEDLMTAGPDSWPRC